MASVRRLVTATSADDLAQLDIRIIDQASVVNLWASSVSVTDKIGLSLGKVELLPASTVNVSAAALGQVSTDEDQIIFGMLVGAGVGDLRISIPTLTTSLIYLLSVEPFLG